MRREREKLQRVAMAGGKKKGNKRKHKDKREKDKSATTSTTIDSSSSSTTSQSHLTSSTATSPSPPNPSSPKLNGNFAQFLCPFRSCFFVLVSYCAYDYKLFVFMPVGGLPRSLPFLFRCPCDPAFLISFAGFAFPFAYIRGHFVEQVMGMKRPFPLKKK